MENKFDDELRSYFQEKKPKANLSDSIMTQVAHESQSANSTLNQLDTQMTVLIGSLVLIGVLSLYWSWDISYPFLLLDTLQNSEFFQFFSSPLYAWGLIMTAGWLVADRLLSSMRLGLMSLI